MSEKYTAGFRDRLFDKDPFPLAIWYPAMEPESSVRHMGVASGAARGADFAGDGPFPMVLFSHGSEGHRFNQFWLAEYLARRGYIVAAPQHHGDNYLDASEARQLAIIERRPREMRLALDLLLDHADISDHIDRDKIYALGHSAGGATVLKLAGWDFDAQAWQNYCNVNAEADKVICQFAPSDDHIDQLHQANGGPVISERDDRIAAIIAITPAFGVAATDEGLNDVNVPMLFIEADTDEILHDHVNAAHFRKLLRGRAKFVKVKGAGHYSFLPKCTPYIAENFSYLCRDFGQDRDTIHRTVEQVIHRFLDRVKTGEIQGR
ncbi:alpha/beta hydrolase family protein [Thalassospira australica]|uniref:alpha/beta hydrolase family protein n=1 Tax=Thalassospira australica TaxID=1528106 RepID=UPI00051A8888|nr:alpha/beta fold hydrolase [Thalassospira australica]